MNIKKILYTVLVILWMIIVFRFSNQQGTGSSNTSMKFVNNIIDIVDIKKEMTEETKKEIISILEPVVRKLAHYTIYIVGGILLVNCTFAYNLENNIAIYISGIIGVLYASSDEIHQLFIPGRSGRITDVIIDSIGIFTGIALYIAIRKIVEIIKAKSKTSKGGEKSDC